MSLNSSYADPGLQVRTVTDPPAVDIDFFETKRATLTLDVSGQMTATAEEILEDLYWLSKIARGLGERAAGPGLPLDEYLADPS